MSVPVFITYRDRREFLDTTLTSLVERGFHDITIIDNDSDPSKQVGEPENGKPYRNVWDGKSEPGGKMVRAKVVYADNSHRQLAPWLLDLVPDDSYYIVMDCDIELVCPDDVEEVLIDILERHPEIEKVGLGIKTDDLLFPPPERYAYSYLMELTVENGPRFKTIEKLRANQVIGSFEVIDAPIDTHFAMHRPGSGWPGIVGARTTAPYHCRHLPWMNEEYSDEEKLYYERAGNAWTVGHSAESLLETAIAVPFTSLRAETVVALAGEKIRYAPMLTDTSYWELLRDLWGAGQSFILVEHDIVVNETTLDELKVCDHDWCAMPFPYRGEERAYSLACTKFSKGIIARHPDLIEIVGQMSDEAHDPMHWCRLDMWLFMVLSELGEVRHEHERATPVGHVGAQFPSHGCL